MIDCHIMHHPNVDRKMLDEAIKSAEDPLVTINLVEWDIDKGPSFREARSKAFLIGSNPYVSFVDADDIVLGKPWREMLGHMNTTQKAVYTNSVINDLTHGWKKTMFLKHKEWTPALHARPYIYPIIHQLVLIDRSVATRAIESMSNSLEPPVSRVEQYIYSEVSKITTWKFLHDVLGYEWRRKATGLHTLYHQHQVRQPRNK